MDYVWLVVSAHRGFVGSQFLGSSHAHGEREALLLLQLVDFDGWLRRVLCTIISVMLLELFAPLAVLLRYIVGTVPS